MATGKGSCSLDTNYNYHTRVFYNYDPSSGTWGALHFEEGPASWTSPEGMWYSSVTDMDFCLVHGKSHDSRGVYLRPYNGVINGKIVKNGYFTGQTVSTQNTTQNATQNSTQNITQNTTPQVQAQNYEEEYMEFIMGNQTYTIDKDMLKEFQINDLWINDL